MLTPFWSVLLAVWLAACGDKGTGSSKPGGVVLDVRFARTAAAKPVAVLRMDRVVATANRGRELVRQQELSYEAGTWKGSLKLPSATYEIAVEAFKGERVRWRGSTSVELSGGKTVTAVVELASTNRAPVLTAIGGQQVAEGDALTLGLSASDADGDELTFSMAGYPAGSSLAGSTFIWTPTHEQAGTYEVTFTVTDGQGGQDSEAVTLTVSGTNRAPVLAEIGDRRVTEGEALTIELSAEDADGDGLTFSVADNPAGSSLAGATFTWTPTHEQAGTYEMTFTVADGQGGQDSEAVILTVSGTNRAPVLAEIGDRRVTEGAALTIELSAEGRRRGRADLFGGGVSGRFLPVGFDLHLDAHPRAGRHLRDDLHGGRRPGRPGQRGGHPHRERDQPGSGAGRDRRPQGDRRGRPDHRAVGGGCRRGRADLHGGGQSGRFLPGRFDLHLDAHPRAGRHLRGDLHGGRRPGRPGQRGGHPHRGRDQPGSGADRDRRPQGDRRGRPDHRAVGGGRRRGRADLFGGGQSGRFLPGRFDLHLDAHPRAGRHLRGDLHGGPTARAARTARRSPSPWAGPTGLRCWPRSATAG